MRRNKFAYDRDDDVSLGPQSQPLPMGRSTATGIAIIVPIESCAACRLLGSSTTNAKADRTRTRHAWQELFGHRHARFRELLRVQCQCLIAAAQNMSKIDLSAAQPVAPAP